MKPDKTMVTKQKEVTKIFIMELYTFLMEFRGGTYISQVKTKSLTDAIKLWVQELNTEGKKYLGRMGKKEMITAVDGIDFSSLERLKNVWFFV